VEQCGLDSSGSKSLRLITPLFNEYKINVKSIFSTVINMKINNSEGE
jgi:hypothetical protein